jgi:hypothetical protein
MPLDEAPGEGGAGPVELGGPVGGHAHEADPGVGQPIGEFSERRIARFGDCLGTLADEFGRCPLPLP